MSGFFKGLMRFLGAILSELATIVLGGVLIVLGFAAVVFGLSIGSMLVSVAGAVSMFFGFIFCLRHFV